MPTTADLARELSIGDEEAVELLRRLGWKNADVAMEFDQGQLDQVVYFARLQRSHADIIDRVAPGTPTRTVEEVYKARSGELMSLAGVTGTGVGVDSRDRSFIRLYVTIDPATLKLPEAVDGYAVIPFLSGGVRAT